MCTEEEEGKLFNAHAGGVTSKCSLPVFGSENVIAVQRFVFSTVWIFHGMKTCWLVVHTLICGCVLKSTALSLSHDQVGLTVACFLYR